MSTGFRLGVVLRLRELAEDAARAELARALQVHRAALDALRRSHRAAVVERERAAALQRASAHGGVTPAGELAEAVASVELAEEAIVAGETRVVAAADDLLGARFRLAEASRRRQVVERLRERTAAAERLRLQRREDATLNELASTRHAWTALEERGR
jgi:flagellar export protein FliJ